jgi:hypothetical protein
MIKVTVVSDIPVKFHNYLVLVRLEESWAWVQDTFMADLVDGSIILISVVTPHGELQSLDPVLAQFVKFINNGDGNILQFW